MTNLSRAEGEACTDEAFEFVLVERAEGALPMPPRGSSREAARPDSDGGRGTAVLVISRPEEEGEERERVWEGG